MRNTDSFHLEPMRCAHVGRVLDVRTRKMCVCKLESCLHSPSLESACTSFLNARATSLKTRVRGCLTHHCSDHLSSCPLCWCHLCQLEVHGELHRVELGDQLEIGDARKNDLAPRREEASEDRRTTHKGWGRFPRSSFSSPLPSSRLTKQKKKHTHKGTPTNG